MNSEKMRSLMENLNDLQEWDEEDEDQEAVSEEHDEDADEEEVDESVDEVDEEVQVNESFSPNKSMLNLITNLDSISDDTSEVINESEED